MTVINNVYLFYFFKKKKTANVYRIHLSMYSIMKNVLLRTGTMLRLIGPQRSRMLRRQFNHHLNYLRRRKKLVASTIRFPYI